MIGQGLIPKQYHSVVDEMTLPQLTSYLSSIESNIQRQVEQIPNHDDFLRQLVGNQ